jgi:hypothetical protein
MDEGTERKSLLRRIDSSPLLIGVITRLSTLLARQRGLPAVVGIILVIIAFIIQTVNVFADSQLLELLGVITHSVGVLTALIGFLLAEPLGK